MTTTQKIIFTPAAQQDPASKAGASASQNRESDASRIIRKALTAKPPTLDKPTDVRAADAHTPGPWRVQRVHEKETGFRSVQIVSVSGLNIASVVMQLDDKEQANTRLIAAAPETAAERDRLKKERREFATLAVKAERERDQAREQVKTLLKACKIVKGEMDWIYRNFPTMPKSAMQRLGLRFDWSVITAAIASVESEEAK
jgi:plasmid stabilization system protein ParE